MGQVLRYYVYHKDSGETAADIQGEIKMDNYSIYYAVASLASTCESLFSLNGEIKKYMKSRLIDSYWKYTNRLIALKGFSSVAVFCYRLSELDVKKYRNSKTYREEILYYFEAADNFLKEFEKGDDLL